MPNFFWYCSLAATGIITAALVIYIKRRDYKVSTLLVFYMFAACLTWIGEFTALGLFNSYAYMPGAFSDPWAENLTGHLLLNTTMWPAAAVLAAACRLKYGWYPLIIAYFIFAEYLFLRMGIYEQHWWRYSMSVIVVVIFLILTRQWFSKISSTIRKVPRTTVLYFVCFLIIHFPVPFLLLFGKHYYSLDWLNGLTGNLYRSSTIFIFTYQLVEAFIIILFVCVLEKWYWKTVPFVVAAAGQIMMTEMNISKFSGGWGGPQNILVYALCLTAFILIDRYTLLELK